MSHRYQPQPLEPVLFAVKGKHYQVIIDEAGELTVMLVGRRMGKMLISPREFNSVTINSEKPGIDLPPNA